MLNAGRAGHVVIATRWANARATNDMEIGHRQVWVAVAATVHAPPLKGIYSGGKAAALDVTVDMTRLA